MDEELISVIVPVYNTEKYLKRCIESLLNQTYRNIEILLIDDCSTDGSLKICKAFAEKHHNIKVICHEHNDGQSCARNSGLDVAKGCYVGFVDSDDWVAPDMYEYLFHLMKTYEAQISQINFTLAYGINDSFINSKEKIKQLYNKEILQDYMLAATIATGAHSVCRCLFKKEVIFNERFREGKVNEDIDFKYKVLSNSTCFVESNQVKYFYFQSVGSTTTSGLKRRDFDLYEAAEKLWNFTRDENYGNIKLLGEVKKARTAFSLLSKIAYYGIADKSLDEGKIINQLTHEHRHNLRILLSAPLPKSRKILAVLLSINFTLTKKIVDIAKIIKII